MTTSEPLAQRGLRIAVWLISALALTAHQPVTHGAEKQRLNVLVIMADDLRNDLGCYGHHLVKSPNIDRLAARGVRFDRAYCQYPVCNASRASFLSGKRVSTTRIIDNATPPRTFLKDAIFLPQHFRQHGYRAIKLGKIFHTGSDFEDPASWDLDERETREAKNPPNEQILSRGGAENEVIVLGVQDEETYDGKLARRAAAALEKAQEAGHPFFMAVGFRRPHTPYIAPKRYFDMYPPERIRVESEPAEHLQKIPRAALTYNPTTDHAQPGPEDIAAYYASVTFMDAQVGVVLEAVDRLHLWDATVVVFLSDHGYHLGEHGGLWHKMTLFEQSARVPLVVVAPGRKAGAASPRLVELVDLYPTLAELCGLPVPEDLEGTSLVPLLDEPERAWKKAAFTEVSRAFRRSLSEPLDLTRMGHSVRTERYRYTEWFDGSVELYDYEHDARELENLADDPTQGDLRRELEQLLHAGWNAAVPARE